MSGSHTLAELGPCVLDGVLRTPWIDMRRPGAVFSIALVTGAGTPGAVCRLEVEKAHDPNGANAVMIPVLCSALNADDGRGKWYQVLQVASLAGFGWLRLTLSAEGRIVANAALLCNAGRRR